MKDIFKIGNHLVGGISLAYMKNIGTYLFMITLLFIHLTISHSKGKIRFGISIGDHGLFLKLQVGID